MTKFVWAAVFSIIAVFAATAQYPTADFRSLDELGKHWTLTHSGKFMSCESGKLKIIDEGVAVYRCISWMDKNLILNDFMLKVKVTVLNGREEWAGINLNGINFLIRRGGFNYTYRPEGEKTSINKVIPSKIETGKTYLFEITGAHDRNMNSVRWLVDGKEIASFSYSGKLVGAGSMRLGSFGMGIEFSNFELTEYPTGGKAKMQERPRDMTLENTVNLIVEKASETANSGINPQAVIAQKKRLGFKRFPIGAYTDCLNFALPETRQIFSVENEFKDWNEAGFSLVFSPAFNSSDPEQKEAMGKLLELAGKYELKVLLADRNFLNKSRQDIPVEKFRREIKNMGDYFSRFEAFAGFMIADEPMEKNLARTLDFAKAHREVLPGKLPFVNFGFEPITVGKKTWDDFFSSVIKEGQLEVLSYDFYGQMLDRDKPASYYFMILENLRMYSLKNGIPFWFVGLVTPHLYFLEPTFNDLRWQFNTALAYGASGYFWWFYYDERHDINANYRNAPVDWNGDKTESFYYLKRIQQKFRHQYGDLFNHLASTRISHYPNIIGVGEKWTPNKFLEKMEVDVRGTKNSMQHQVLVGEFTDEQNHHYIMVVNNNRNDNIALRLSFPENTVIYHYAHGKEICGFAREYGIGKHWLAPGQELVYRVELQQEKINHTADAKTKQP